MNKLVEGRLCILDKMRREYLPRHVALLNDPEVTCYLRLKPPFTLQNQIEWFNRVSNSQSDIVFAVLAKGPDGQFDTFIGVMGLHGIDMGNKTARSGMIIGDKNYWGRGIGTEAKFLQLRYAFTELKLRLIRSSIAAANLRIRKVLENTGYYQIGVQPQGRFVAGRTCEEVLLEVSKQTWETRWAVYTQGYRK